MARPRRGAHMRGGYGGRLHGWRMVVVFVLAFAVLLGAGYAVVQAAAPSKRQTRCVAGRPCGAPPRAPRALTDLKTWRSPTLGIHLEYDPSLWTLSESDADSLRLQARDSDGALLITAERATTAAAAGDVLDGVLDEVRESVVGLAEDRRPAYRILGPAIGYRRGTGISYAGTTATPQGPGEPLTVSALATSDRGVSAAALVLTAESDPGRRHRLFVHADSILNSFAWPR